MLNENNIQAPFKYKISENTFELDTIKGELELNKNNVQVKIFEGQRLFCADIGYAVDGALEEMEFLIDDIKVYPVLLEQLEDLKSTEVKDNEIYLIKNDINFKSIIFFPPIDLNKNFKYTITTYSSTFSAFMFDEIAEKLNIIDMNIPVKNYYKDNDYKINDIIKYNGYLYRVFREFKSDGTDYYLQSNCNLITPFKKLEINTQYKINDLVEYNNNFFTVQKDFDYDNTSNINELLKPIQDIIEWNDNIKKVYTNQIILKDNFCYLVLASSENYTFDELMQFKRIDYLNKASNTFYDDINSNFGNNTNTVQKAIENLNSKKQNNLVSGNNININGNTININGGVSKNYFFGSEYFTNDLILYENRLYIANENFISSDWDTDKNKLTLLTSSGSLATASQVAYDNNKTNLKYISEYDFPKFKIEIPETINLILTDNINDYTAAIIKQEDGSYILNSQLDNFKGSTSIIVKSIEESSNIYEMYSILSQFFEFNNSEYYQLSEDECIIDSISGVLKFALLLSENNIIIDIKNESNINQENYNITLSIKNRVLRKSDTNIFFACQQFNNLFNLKLIQNYDKVNIKGSLTCESENKTFNCFSPILENYFNLITYSNDNSLLDTEEIISSTGKAVKFGFAKDSINENNYTLILSHQDGSAIEIGEVFTFDLTPNKNLKTNPIYSLVTNVQQLGEALNSKFSNLDIIADGKEHFTGRYYQNTDGAKKPIYYRMFQKEYIVSQEVIGNISEWAVDEMLKNTFLKRWGGSGGVWQGNDSVSIGGTQFGGFQTASTNYNSNGDITINLGMSDQYGYGWNGIKHLYFEYTKTTDSLEY